MSAAASSSSAHAAAGASAAAAASSDGIAISASSSRLQTDVTMPLQLELLPEPLLSRCDEDQQRAIASAPSSMQTLYELSVDDSVLPALCRLMNQLAHTLLLGAELNGGRVALRGPPHPASISDIEKHAAAEAHKCAADPSRLVLSASLAQRWLGEYRELHVESSLQLDAEGLASLDAVVEYILVQVVYEAACRCDRLDAPWITGEHVLHGIYHDSDLAMLCTWLGAPIRVDNVSAGLSSAMMTLHPTSMPLLAYEAQFASHSAMLHLSSSCWFNSPAKVALYAQQYARGELLAGDALLYRQHGVRLLRFYGRLQEDLSEDQDENVHPVSVLSFELQDLQGRWHPYILEIQSSQGYVTTLFNAVFGTAALQRCTLRYAEDAEQRRSLDFAEMLFSEHVQSSRAAAKSLWKLDFAASSGSRSVSACSPLPAAASDAAAASLFDAAVPIVLCSAPEDALTRLMEQKRMEEKLHRKFRTLSGEQRTLGIEDVAKMHQVCRLLCDAISPERWSPQLMSAHHPLRVRAHFTAALLDHASQSVGLPLLPMDLLQLIGEYEPATLPVIEAEEQLVTAEERAARVQQAQSTVWQPAFGWKNLCAQ